MNAKSVWTMLIVGIAAAGPLLGVAWFHRLGSFAKSPQTAEIMVGGTVLVGGGRAKLLFSSVELGPVVEVSCKGDKRTLELFQDRVSDAVCGIRLSKPEVVEGVGGSLRLRVQVEWDERG
jgi:hypothetical protein